MAWLLVFAFAMSIIAFLIHDNKLSSLDQSSRYFLAVPILLFMLAAPPRLSYLWAGIAVGSVTAAGVAAWQVHWLGVNRATGFVTSAIPFGNIGLTMGMLSLAGIFWARTQGTKRILWYLILSVATIAGGYCSLASLSRGGWLAIIPVLCFFGVAFLTKKNLYKAIISCILLIVTLALLFLIPRTGIQTRYEQAAQGVTDYLYKDNSNSSAGERLEAWRAALINIPKKPIFGWSREEYNLELELLASEGKVDPLIIGLANTHNNFLEVWLFQGLPGFVALIGLFLFPFWCFYKRLRCVDIEVRVLALCGIILVTSFAIFSITQVILGRNNGVTFFAMTLIIFWSCLRNRESTLKDNDISQNAV